MASVSKKKWTHKGVAKECWAVRYVDPTGAYRSKSFDRKKDADAHRLRIENELAGGTHIAPSQSRTVAAAVEAFLEDIDNKVAIGALRRTTADNYHSAFKRSIVPALGHRLILDVQSVDLENWYANIVRAKKMEPVTAARRLWFVKAMFDFAIRKKWVRKGCNPVPDAMEAIGRIKKNKIEVFKLEDMRKIIAAANIRPFKGRQRSFETLRLAVNLGAFCGLRWGEIFGLTVSNVDLVGKVIRIRHTIDGHGFLAEPKTEAGNRSVPMPNHIAQMMTEFLAKWKIKNNYGIIFETESGGAMVASNFRSTSWVPLQARAGVASAKGAPIRFHALRHFAVSWMIENGWPITDVSAMIGHTNVSTTLDIYAHVVKGRVQSSEAMQQLAERLLESTAPSPNTPLLIDARVTNEIINGEFVNA